MITMKAYLGDGVYLDYDGYALVLTTEDGIRATNTIVLEPAVYHAFTKYVTALFEKDAQNAKGTP